MVQLSGGVVERSWMVADGPVGDPLGRRPWWFVEGVRVRGTRRKRGREVVGCGQ